MELVRSLRELFASVSDAPHAGPAEVLASGGHQSLPPDLVAEAITNYADTAPLEVAQHLAPFVMAHSAVPGAAEAANWTGDGIGPDLETGFELLSTVPAVSDHPGDHDFGVDHDFGHDVGDVAHDVGHDVGDAADAAEHGLDDVTDHALDHGFGHAFTPQPQHGGPDLLDLDFGHGQSAAANVAGHGAPSVAQHDPAAGWAAEFGAHDDPSFAEGLIDTGLDDPSGLDDDLFDHGLQHHGHGLGEHTLIDHLDTADPEDHHDLPFEHGGA